MQPDAIEPGTPEDWLRHAISDLELSKKNDSPLILKEELCYHAQQATEKSIKAVLISKNIQFPKTHNISVLTDLVPAVVYEKSLFDDIAILTDYAVSARYPGNMERISIEEYEESIELAKLTVEWAKKILSF